MWLLSCCFGFSVGLLLRWLGCVGLVGILYLGRFDVGVSGVVGFGVVEFWGCGVVEFAGVFSPVWVNII